MELILLFAAESVYNQTVAVSCCYSSDSWCQLWSLLVACATFVCRVTQIMRKVIDIFPQAYRVSVLWEYLGGLTGKATGLLIISC